MTQTQHATDPSSRSRTHTAFPPEGVQVDVLEAAQNGSELDLLVAMRDRVARAVADPDCPKRDLASLTLRLANIVKDIKALESAEGDDEIGKAANLPDGEFDPASI